MLEGKPSARKGSAPPAAGSCPLSSQLLWMGCCAGSRMLCCNNPAPMLQFPSERVSPMPFPIGKEPTPPIFPQALPGASLAQPTSASQSRAGSCCIVTMLSQQLDRTLTAHASLRQEIKQVWDGPAPHCHQALPHTKNKSTQREARNRAQHLATLQATSCALLGGHLLPSVTTCQVSSNPAGPPGSSPDPGFASPLKQAQGRYGMHRAPVLIAMHVGQI